MKYHIATDIAILADMAQILLRSSLDYFSSLKGDREEDIFPDFFKSLLRQFNSTLIERDWLGALIFHVLLYKIQLIGTGETVNSISVRRADEKFSSDVWYRSIYNDIYRAIGPVSEAGYCPRILDADKEHAAKAFWRMDDGRARNLYEAIMKGRSSTYLSVLKWTTSDLYYYQMSKLPKSVLNGGKKETLTKSMTNHKVKEYLDEGSTVNFPALWVIMRDSALQTRIQAGDPIRIVVAYPDKNKKSGCATFTTSYPDCESLENGGLDLLLRNLRCQISSSLTTKPPSKIEHKSDSGDDSSSQPPGKEDPSGVSLAGGSDSDFRQADGAQSKANHFERPRVDHITDSEAVDPDLNAVISSPAACSSVEPTPKQLAAIRVPFERLKSKTKGVRTTPEDYAYTIECIKQYTVAINPQIDRHCPINVFVELSKKQSTSEEIMYRTKEIRAFLREIIITCIVSIDTASRSRRQDAARIIMTIIASIEKKGKEKTKVRKSGERMCSFILLVLLGILSTYLSTIPLSLM